MMIMWRQRYYTVSRITATMQDDGVVRIDMGDLFKQRYYLISNRLPYIERAWFSKHFVPVGDWDASNNASWYVVKDKWAWPLIFGWKIMCFLSKAEEFLWFGLRNIYCTYRRWRWPRKEGV